MGPGKLAFLKVSHNNYHVVQIWKHRPFKPGPQMDSMDFS
jgi:hypothetical protein